MTGKLPQHIAIIPDGNRRWARKRSLPTYEGHVAGGEAAKKVLRTARSLGVDYGTIWGASLSNVQKREKQEINFLFDLFGRLVDELVQEMENGGEQAQIRVSGEWRKYAPADICQKFDRATEVTQHHKARILNVLVAYDGREDLLRAMREVAAGGGDFSREAVEKRLASVGMPPVDLVIRTGAHDDPHLSGGFMMWEIAEAQLYFSKKLWPAFGEEDLHEALAAYAERERRLGK